MFKDKTYLFSYINYVLRSDYKFNAVSESVRRQLSHDFRQIYLIMQDFCVYKIENSQLNIIL